MERARADGAVVLLGGCIGLAEGSLPFAPIVEALRPYIRELEGIDGDGASSPDGAGTLSELPGYEAACANFSILATRLP